MLFSFYYFSKKGGKNSKKLENPGNWCCRPCRRKRFAYRANRPLPLRPGRLFHQGHGGREYSGGTEGGETVKTRDNQQVAINI